MKAPIGSRKTCPNTMNRQQYVAEGGLRVDVFLSEKTGLTRSAVKKLIDEGHVLVSGRSVKAGAVLKDGEEIQVEIPDPRPIAARPEDIPLDIVYEDEDIASSISRRA